jgi:hypothetical protein
VFNRLYSPGLAGMVLTGYISLMPASWVQFELQ